MCVCVCVSEREGVDKKAARRVVDFVTPPGKKKSGGRVGAEMKCLRAAASQDASLERQGGGEDSL